MADAVDLVAKELKTHGSLALRREDVDGVAVHAEEAGAVRRVGRRVAHGHEAARHVVKGNLLAHRKALGGEVVLARGRHAAQQRAGRGDHDAGVAAVHALERLAAAGDNRGLGLGILPGVVATLWVARHVLEAHVSGERPGGALGRLLARDDVDRRPWVARELRRGEQRARRLRHGERHVVATAERRLHRAQGIDLVELCGNAMNEHGNLFLSSRLA